MINPAAGAFRSLRSFNFRLWTAGALVSNIGTWMQRIAQAKTGTVGREPVSVNGPDVAEIKRNVPLQQGG